VELLPMTRMRFGLCWALASLVAAYDGYFAWNYRHVFQTWEVNPLARGLAEVCGVPALLTLKAVSFLFAMAVAVYCRSRRHRLETPYSLTVGGAHLTLGALYVAGHLEPLWR
jgi:hypothetical protein